MKQLIRFTLDWNSCKFFSVKSQPTLWILDIQEVVMMSDDGQNVSTSYLTAIPCF